MISRTAAPRWIIALALLLLLGVGFRFYNLDKKIFWMDEAGTILRISGYSVADVRAQIERKPLWSPAEFQKFQRIDSSRTLNDAVRVLSVDDPQHPPLFYGSLRLWAGIFGESVFALRLFPALLSLLVFPAAWWLCRELFFDEPKADQITYVVLALMAASPFHALYAQELRQYSLLTAVCLASSALLLRAVRRGGFWPWALYALSVAIGFYTHTLFILMWLAHGAIALAFAWTIYRGKNNTNEARLASGKWHHLLAVFALASLGGALLFSPWAVLVWKGKAEASQTTSWVAAASSLGFLIKTWVFMYSSLYFDPNHTQRWSGALAGNLVAVQAVRLLRPTFFGMVLYALYFVWRQAPRRIGLFICLFAAVPFAAFAIPDLLLGGSRSTISRFLIPSFLGVQFAVAYLLATKLSDKRRAWTVVFILLIASGLGSCFLSSQSHTWWNKSASLQVPNIARIVNREATPLLVTDFSNNLLSINRLIKPQARILFVPEKAEETFNLSQIKAVKPSAVFFYAPSKTLRQSLQNQGKALVNAGAGNELWRLQN